MTTASLPPGKSRLVTPYRIVVSVLLAFAAAALYVAFASFHEKEPSIINAQNVVAVRPESDSIALRQARIYAKLKDGYVGSLVVNGVELPADQVDHLEGANTVGFTPGPQSAVGTLKAGQNCALVFYWRAEESRATAQSYKWCWKVTN